MGDDAVVRAIGRALLRRPTAPGAIVGAVFWWFSLVPSLMPRAWTVQAAISAICIGIGYALGTLGRWIARKLRGDRPPREPTLADRLLGRVPRWLPITAVAIVLIVGGCRFWVRWQNQQRQLLAMDPVSLSATIPMIVFTVVLTLVLAIIGRLLGGVVRRGRPVEPAPPPAFPRAAGQILLVVSDRRVRAPRRGRGCIRLVADATSPSCYTTHRLAQWPAMCRATDAPNSDWWVTWGFVSSVGEVAGRVAPDAPAGLRSRVWLENEEHPARGLAVVWLERGDPARTRSKVGVPTTVPTQQRPWRN